MVDNQNSIISRKVAKYFQVQEAQGIPKIVPNAISPVVDVTPIPTFQATKSFFGTRTTTGTGTLVTIDADKDFFLTNLSYFLQCDAVADSTDYSVRATTNGLNQRIIQIQKLSLTATTVVIEKPFFTPLKIDKGTTITFPSAFTVGASSISVSCQGYFEE